MGRDLDLDDVVAQYPEAKRELAELREEIAAWTGECEQLRQDLAAARADAERYRWLRKVATPPTLAGIAWGNSEAACKFSDPDAAIDAALAGEKK